ncbi:MAG: phosphodiester glycosidase family protein [Candidatus Promineifilaceae bacterium]|nr:phosphodiester glycosidase family protein [Candidatus Promineifilaceae bacterium]
MARLQPALWLLGIYLLLMMACARSAATPGEFAAPTPTRALLSPQPTASPIPADRVDNTPTTVPDSGWRELRHGLDRRVINVQRVDGSIRETLYLLRIDPAHFRIDVAYRPGQPRSLQQWQAETGALIVVNAGFFTVDYVATGLIVAGGQASGESYRDFGGMLAVNDQQVTLRWLPQQPYVATESWTAAVQAFPMLIRPAGLGSYTAEDGLVDRRTVVALDGDGRLLLILATRGAFTLAELSRFLQESDLQLDSALNLDGGASTGLLLAEPAEGVPAFSPLPAVITVHARTIPE